MHPLAALVQTEKRQQIFPGDIFEFEMPWTRFKLVVKVNWREPVTRSISTDRNALIKTINEVA